VAVVIVEVTRIVHYFSLTSSSSFVVVVVAAAAAVVELMRFPHDDSSSID
jgi:hypothetical protein